jgi:hypothetical protein
MLADLDLLLIAVFCTADDLLPEKAKNARRSVTDAEVITLCVAQAIMGIASDVRFLAVARKRLLHLFPRLPGRPGYWKRRHRLADVIEALTFEFAPAAKTNPDTVRTSRRSASGSRASSGPAKTSSRSNATAHAPSTDSENACSSVSSRSPPASRSTTNSATPPATSPPTTPNTAELLI